MPFPEFEGSGFRPVDEIPRERGQLLQERRLLAGQLDGRLGVPHIEKAGGGAVLNISSMSAENKNVRMASYSSSKAAISHLTRNIAFDLGPKNIRVNAIAPGAIRTDALATVLTPEVEAAMLKHTPLKRLGLPEDIAAAALFLCAPASNWVSGQILTVSGGGVQELD